MFKSIRTAYALIVLTIVMILAANLIYQDPRRLASYSPLIFIVLCVAMIFVVRVLHRMPDRRRGKIQAEADARFRAVGKHVDTRKNLG